MTPLLAAILVFHGSIHWRVDSANLGQCQATITCTGERCEALALPDTCTHPWTLEQCLESTVAVPGDDVADTLGCDPFARVLDIDWTPNP